MDDKHYLLSLIREGEHQQQDFKYRVADACKLAKSVSAFANTDGGRLLIGVRDDEIRHLLSIMRGRQTLNQIVSLSRLPRYKVIGLLARLIRFNTIRWEYDAQKFLFSMM